MNVPYSYLDEQFADIDEYLEDVRKLVQSGDFTLGKSVTEFEERFARLCGLPYAIGVGSGTDALILSLKILGIGPGDEVITTPNTFISTVGAIAMVGARPVFVDNNQEYTIDADKIEQAITPKTKALLPVHLTGSPADMPRIMEIAKRHKLSVVEDAAQAILAKIDGKHVGSWGETACFSLHPLKNLNVWGDGGIIVTRSAELCRKLKLFRNHGMSTRDEIEMFSHNSRLDSLQAVIGNRLILKVEDITNKRIANARRYDEAFKNLQEYITVPRRCSNVQQVYHTYVLRVKNRDGLLRHLVDRGIKAKVHYPIPVHLQKAAAHLGYKKGDFPICEEDARTIISLPVHQHLTAQQMAYVIDCVREFYRAGGQGSKKEDACLPAGRRCILGVDFDNTLVNYDDVFLRTAQRMGFIASAVTKHKTSIRDAIRQVPDGEKKWQQVQAHVYGRAMDEAVLIDGVQEFLQMCRRLGVPVYIVSHKTKFAAQDTDKIDLRRSAMNWMTQKDFFELKGLGFSVDQVFFESTRRDKVGRIKQLGCTHFIDDLEETFLEESFPRGVTRILYSPYAGNSLVPDAKVFRTWAQIEQYFMSEKYKHLEIDS